MTTLPSGVRSVADFITRDAEQDLVGSLDPGPWSHELKRRVQHFGYRYDYKARTVTSDAFIGPLPHWLKRIGRRLVDGGLLAEMPDQVIANEYLPGQGISAHVDCVPCFGDAIVSLSLLSPCEMIFRSLAGSECRGLVLMPRSLILLQRESRYGWTHEIPARKSDVIDGIRTNRSRRISLTFRKVVRPD